MHCVLLCVQAMCFLFLSSWLHARYGEIQHGSGCIFNVGGREGDVLQLMACHSLYTPYNPYRSGLDQIQHFIESGQDWTHGQYMVVDIFLRVYPITKTRLNSMV
jgi:hypothetical protein